MNRPRRMGESPYTQEIEVSTRSHSAPCFAKNVHGHWHALSCDMSLAAAKTDPSADGRIPVLDIGAYLAGEAGAAPLLARAIACTCEDTGFLVIANHGVPQQLVDDTFAVAQQFFARSEPEKLALKVGKYNIGYLPFGGQVVRHSPVNKNSRRIFCESFYITRDRAPDHPDIVNQKPLIGPNRWPP